MRATRKEITPPAIHLPKNVATTSGDGWIVTTTNPSKRAIPITLADGKSTTVLPPNWSSSSRIVSQNGEDHNHNFLASPRGDEAILFHVRREDVDRIDRIATTLSGQLQIQKALGNSNGDANFLRESSRVGNLAGVQLRPALGGPFDAPDVVMTKLHPWFVFFGNSNGMTYYVNVFSAKSPAVLLVLNAFRAKPIATAVPPNSLPSSVAVKPAAPVVAEKNWLPHYLPQDQQKLKGRIWLAISVDNDGYFHKPSCPVMLGRSPDDVIGFSSLGTADESGRLPHDCFREARFVNVPGKLQLLADAQSFVLLPKGWTALGRGLSFEFSGTVRVCRSGFKAPDGSFTEITIKIPDPIRSAGDTIRSLDDQVSALASPETALQYDLKVLNRLVALKEDQIADIDIAVEQISKRAFRNRDEAESASWAITSMQNRKFLLQLEITEDVSAFRRRRYLAKQGFDGRTAVILYTPRKTMVASSSSDSGIQTVTAKGREITTWRASMGRQKLCDISDTANGVSAIILKDRIQASRESGLLLKTGRYLH